jgi:hypothetical protein
MTQTTFVKALHKEAPGLISDISGPRDRDNDMPIAFQVKPAADGVQLSIRFGDEDPRDLLFASETDAAKFLGRVYKSVKLTESAFSLLRR